MPDVAPHLPLAHVGKQPLFCRLSQPAALITLQASVCGVNLSIPVFAWPPSAPSSSAHAAPASASAAATYRPQVAAPSAEVAELQRRLLATGDADVASLMTPDPDQLDPLDVRGIARWLKAKGRDLDIAEEQILTHAHWRKSYMPAGHIPEVCMLHTCCVYANQQDLLPLSKYTFQHCV